MSHVKMVPLGDVATLQAGVGFPMELQGRSSGAYPLAKVRDISRGGRSGKAILSSADHYIDEIDLERLRTKPIPKGSVLFAKIGEAISHNHRVITGCDMLIDNNAMAAIPGPDITSDYLYYYLRSLDFYRLASATTVPALRKSELEKIPIPLPPLPEQRRIAEILDQADALRAKRRAALAQLDSLAQSIFFDLFGDLVSNPKKWPLVPLPTVVYFQEGPGIRNWQFRDQGIKLINVGNIVDGELVIENTKRHLDPAEVEGRYKHFLLNAGDYVVASSGVTWGKIAEVQPWQLPLCLNTSMIRFRPRSEALDKIFLRAFVESQSFRGQILRLITGSAQPNFGPAHLKQVLIPQPPLSLQRELSRRASAVEGLKSTYRSSLAKLDGLFASLQSEAFRGEL